MTEWGSYCQTKIYGSCPISCRSDQPLGYEQNIEPSIFTGRWPTRIYCYETPYDEYGNMNWDGVWQDGMRLPCCLCHRFLKTDFDFQNTGDWRLFPNECSWFGQIPWIIGSRHSRRKVMVPDKKGLQSVRRHVPISRTGAHATSSGSSPAAQAAEGEVRVGRHGEDCSLGWCIPKWDSCPIDCGDNIMCSSLAVWRIEAQRVAGQMSCAQGGS